MLNSALSDAGLIAENWGDIVGDGSSSCCSEVIWLGTNSVAPGFLPPEAVLPHCDDVKTCFSEELLSDKFPLSPVLFPPVPVLCLDMAEPGS